MNASFFNPFSLPKSLLARASTLVEVMVTTAIVGLAGAVVYHILTVSLHLQAKNVSLNNNTQQGRLAYQIMAANLREAISVPRLINANRQNVSGNVSASGFSMLSRAGGPFLIRANVASNSSNITLQTGSFQPEVDDWVVIPSFNIERRITGVSSTGSGLRLLTLESTVGETINITNPPYQDNKVVAYIGRREQYVVQNGQLRYYPKDSSNAFRVLARNVTTPTPFSLPNRVDTTRRIEMALSCEEAGLAARRGLFRRDGLALSTRAAARFQLTQGL